MVNLPFFNFPYNNYYRHYYYNKNLEKRKKTEDSVVESSDDTEIITEKKTSRYNNDSIPTFEILGIRLYLDDIIILGLLFFLYKEEVHDEMLFLSLIMLLLS